jgi:hypothetical protein
MNNKGKRRTHDPGSTISIELIRLLCVDRWRDVHGNESNNFYVLELPLPFSANHESFIPFERSGSFRQLFVWRGSITRVGVRCSHKLFKPRARLPENLDVRKKIPRGELNMLVRPLWQLAFNSFTRNPWGKENSSVFSRHIKVICKVTLSFNPGLGFRV